MMPHSNSPPPPPHPSPPRQITEGDMAAFQVESGLVSSISGELSRRGYPIFYLSTDSSDYVLVRADQLDAAIEVLHHRYAWVWVHMGGYAWVVLMLCPSETLSSLYLALLLHLVRFKFTMEAWACSDPATSDITLDLACSPEFEHERNMEGGPIVPGVSLTDGAFVSHGGVGDEEEEGEGGADHAVGGQGVAAAAASGAFVGPLPLHRPLPLSSLAAATSSSAAAAGAASAGRAEAVSGRDEGTASRSDASSALGSEAMSGPHALPLGQVADAVARALDAGGLTSAQEQLLQQQQLQQQEQQRRLQGCASPSRPGPAGGIASIVIPGVGGDVGGMLSGALLPQQQQQQQQQHAGTQPNSAATSPSIGSTPSASGTAVANAIAAASPTRQLSQQRLQGLGGAGAAGTGQAPSRLANLSGMGQLGLGSEAGSAGAVGDAVSGLTELPGLAARGRVGGCGERGAGVGGEGAGEEGEKPGQFAPSFAEGVSDVATPATAASCPGPCARLPHNHSLGLGAGSGDAAGAGAGMSGGGIAESAQTVGSAHDREPLGPDGLPTALYEFQLKLLPGTLYLLPLSSRDLEAVVSRLTFVMFLADREEVSSRPRGLGRFMCFSDIDGWVQGWARDTACCGFFSSYFAGL